MNEHIGHRDRIRKSYIKSGLANAEGRQVLEFILTYALPRIDVNPVVDRLLERFGSLAGVMDARIEDLTQVKHVSENVAVLLKLSPQISDAYQKSRKHKKPYVRNTSEAIDYMRPLVATEINEVIFVLCLDHHLRLDQTIRLCEGTLTRATINVKKLYQVVEEQKPEQIVIVHNHNGPSAHPSPADIRTTKHLVIHLRSIGVELSDHLIFASGEVFSFNTSGLMDF